MPTFSKVSHISFSARDADRSATWWSDIFGLKEIERVRGDGWRAILLIHPATATIIEFQQHYANQGEGFDPARTGFDHLGFKVDDPAQLGEWQSHFEEQGVTYTPVAHHHYGSVLTFKDPDGIQFEMFYRADHP
ncbi:VOC family protein [Lentzea sp. NPDC051213]|uniref:VOC family protein n=1 Tax=Lentzea sp. NPDC051213 TaxID=3364126 RepID=UPI0037B617A9